MRWLVIPSYCLTYIDNFATWRRTQKVEYLLSYEIVVIDIAARKAGGWTSCNINDLVSDCL